MNPSFHQLSSFACLSTIPLPPNKLWRSIGIRAWLPAFLLLGWLFPATVPGQEVKCPPAAGDPGPVPGVVGETGWLVTNEVDDVGNKIELWCLQPGNGHSGPDFGEAGKRRTAPLEHCRRRQRR